MPVVRRSATRIKAKVEAHGVTVAEWVVLRALFDHERIKPSALAHQLHLTRGAVSKLIDRLYAKQLVSCQADEQDRRAQLLSLSSTGRKLVPRLASLADQNDREAFGHLDPEQRAALLALLKDLARRHALKGAPID